MASHFNRRSIRLRGYDYTQQGAYFVTVCTEGRRRLFGAVVNGRMALNDAGRVVAACWRDIPNHFPHVALDEWVVMPDHVHGIIVIGHLSPHGMLACLLADQPRDNAVMR